MDYAFLINFCKFNATNKLTSDPSTSDEVDSTKHG